MPWSKLLLHYFVLLIGNFLLRSDDAESKGTIPFCKVNEKCPFDDLTVEELHSVQHLIRLSDKFPPNIIYAIVRAQEPKKSDWISGKGKNFREGYAAVFDEITNTLSEVIVDLKSRTIKSIKQLPEGTFPQLLQKGTEILSSLSAKSPPINNEAVRWLSRNSRRSGIRQGGSSMAGSSQKTRD